MRLEHRFEIPADVETAWRLLLDLERVAPCLPGADLTEKLDDDHYRADVKVKLGPMQMTYKGEVSIVARDESARRAVFEAKGNEAHGQGRAQVVITTTLAAGDGTTTAHMVTDLQITGRVAQMGHGVIQDVSNRMLADFAACLSQRLGATGAAAPQSAPDSAASSAPSRTISALGLLFAVLRGRMRQVLGRS